MKLILFNVEQKYCSWLRFRLGIFFINQFYKISFLLHALNGHLYKHSSLLQYFLFQFLFVRVFCIF